MVRTRLAPSPTGVIHIGNLRTALYAYMWAKKNNGQYIIRIEDTDRTRLVDGAIDAIFHVHTVLGLTPDESIRHGGDYGPYIQSERLHIYAPRLHSMCQSGTAYYCFCDSERLSTLREEQESLKLPPGYDGHCRNIPYTEAKSRVDAGEVYTIRLKVPKNEILVHTDAVLGRIEFNTNDVEDQILLKSDGYPTYHGAIVIDDDMMQISHVMRGVEWTSSIPKQILTARALGITLPVYAHLPHVLGTDGKKLSKRTGDTSVEQYLEKGYLVPALLNFLALLGWHPGTDTEIMPMSDMIQVFDISSIHRSGAVLDTTKLDWMNGEYIKKMDIHILQDLLGTYLRTYAADFYTTVYTQPVHTAMNLRILGDIQTRMKKFDEYIPLTETFYADTVPVRTDLLVNPKMKIEDMQMVKESLELVHSVLSTCMYDTLDDIKTPLLEHIAQAGKKNGQVLWPARVALSGAEFSPGAFEMAYILGREKSLARIQQVLESIPHPDPLL